MRYPNLRAEMARSDIDAYDLAKACGLSESTIHRRLGTGAEFSFSEAQDIRCSLFPLLPIDYLFDLDGASGGYYRNDNADGADVPVQPADDRAQSASR